MLASQIELDPQLEEFDFDDREREVLRLLASERNGYFSFQELRRRLGFHQETLARTLKRLEHANMIERTPEGYRVKGTSASFSFDVPAGQFSEDRIIEAYLPARIDVTVLFQKLKGRWFGTFRWLGYSQDGNELSMSWISEDGLLEIQARVVGSKLIIASTNAANREDIRLVSAAYQLFEHVSKVAEEAAHQTDPTVIAS